MDELIFTDTFGEEYELQITPRGELTISPGGMVLDQEKANELAYTLLTFATSGRLEPGGQGEGDDVDLA